MMIETETPIYIDHTTWCGGCLGMNARDEPR
jgi:hypothetical protein